MAQNYECALLIKPSLTDEAVQEYLDEFSKQITDRAGEVVHVQKWGKRTMEYPIAGCKEAFYVFFGFRLDSGAGGLIEELERLVRINDDLLREMTVKVDELKIASPPTGSSRFTESARLSYAGGRRSGGFRGREYGSSGRPGTGRPSGEGGETAEKEEGIAAPGVTEETKAVVDQPAPTEAPVVENAGDTEKAPEA